MPTSRSPSHPLRRPTQSPRDCSGTRRARLCRADPPRSGPGPLERERTASHHAGPEGLPSPKVTADASERRPVSKLGPLVPGPFLLRPRGRTHLVHLAVSQRPEAVPAMPAVTSHSTARGPASRECGRTTGAGSGGAGSYSAEAGRAERGHLRRRLAVRSMALSCQFFDVGLVFGAWYCPLVPDEVIEADEGHFYFAVGATDVSVRPNASCRGGA